MAEFPRDSPPGAADRRLSHLSRRAVIGRAAAAGASLAGAAYLSRSSVAASRVGASMTQSTPVATSPTVVLVHGAWADASSWAGVITSLQQAGVTVVAPANPLRGLTGDAAYVASVVGQITGPVLLVGHSYGGAVITDAASQVDNVVGLVYVAAFIPDVGETILALSGQATDSLLGPALRPAQYPTGTGGAPGTEFFIDPASFRDVFCADLPAERAAVLAATQRSAADLAFGEPTQSPAWKSLPSWAAVGTADMAIGVAGSRMMAARAGAITVEVDASHVVMISQPQAVADLITTAIGSLA